MNGIVLAISSERRSNLVIDAMIEQRKESAAKLNSPGRVYLKQADPIVYTRKPENALILTRLEDAQATAQRLGGGFFMFEADVDECDVIVNKYSLGRVGS